MMRLIAKDFRCFRELDVPIAPLTLLIGENSTGKSSLLALLRLAWNIGFSRDVIEFNVDPFLLGAFDDIAHYHGGQGKRAKRFEIGIDIKINGMGSKKNETPASVRFLGAFEKMHGHPHVTSRVMRCGEYAIEMTHDSKEMWRVQITAPQAQQEIAFTAVGHGAGSSAPPPFDLIPAFARWEEISSQVENTKKNKSKKLTQQQWAYLNQCYQKALSREPWALAPVRTEPRRHYDPVSDTPKPSGDHVPMMLARISRDEQEEWKNLSRRIDEFGTESGLFDDVKIVQGKKENDPIHVEIAVRDQKGSRNLIDVGYGVSQALPVLVDVLRRENSNRWLLLQQPEVHLHPKAQAALGSLFAELVKIGNRRFVIETHSDYLVDRVCMAVRDGLSPDQVVILYFEPQGTSVEVHPVTLDKQGNLLKTPPGFRKFFLDEQRRFLGL